MSSPFTVGARLRVRAALLALAAEAGVPFLFVSASEFQSMFYGQTNRKIRAFFKALRKAAHSEGGAIGFMLYAAGTRARKDGVPWYDWMLVAASLACAVYMTVELDGLLFDVEEREVGSAAAGGDPVRQLR